MSVTNSLTKSIIKYLQLNGHQAERISPEGRTIRVKRTSMDYTGGLIVRYDTKRIPSSMTPGTADISATIDGRSVKIEIKTGKDVQSNRQRLYQEQVERAGGTYVIIRTWDQFVTWYLAFREDTDDRSHGT